MAWKPEITDWRFHECSLKSLQSTSHPLVLDSWVRGQAKCGIKLSPESWLPNRTQQFCYWRGFMSMEEAIFDGFFCGFLICNSLRFCEESRKHCSSTEPCMWHRTCQAQQRKANAVAIATERRTSGSTSRTSR